MILILKHLYMNFLNLLCIDFKFYGEMLQPFQFCVQIQCNSQVGHNLLRSNVGDNLNNAYSISIMFNAVRVSESSQ